VIASLTNRKLLLLDIGFGYEYGNQPITKYITVDPTRSYLHASHFTNARSLSECKTRIDRSITYGAMK
jgi:hypothetical protein